MSDIVFEKVKDHAWTVKERVFMLKQPSEGFFKRDVLRSFAEFTRKHLCRNLIFGIFLYS